MSTNFSNDAGTGSIAADGFVGASGTTAALFPQGASISGAITGTSISAATITSTGLTKGATVQSTGAVTGSTLSVTTTGTVTGNLSLGGNAILTGYVDNSMSNALIATGSTAAGGLVLTSQVNSFATVASGTGAVLPTVAVAGIGARVTVFNGGASALKVYGGASDTIDGVAAATGVTLTNAKRCDYFATAAATWLSAQLGVASA